MQVIASRAKDTYVTGWLRTKWAGKVHVLPQD